MSSLQENSTVPMDVKRKIPFSRSDSFDKLQYTAFYTLQLAGKLSRNVFAFYALIFMHGFFSPLKILEIQN